MTATVNGVRIRSGGRDGVTTHGMSNTKIYYIWADMVARRTRDTHPRWADYGGRGVTVCTRWREFANFYADMGVRPEGRSLDRRDNSAGYSPENCRWAIEAEQTQNKRPRRLGSLPECRHGVLKHGADRCHPCALDARRAKEKRARK